MTSFPVSQRVRRRLFVDNEGGKKRDIFQPNLKPNLNRMVWTSLFLYDTLYFQEKLFLSLLKTYFSVRSNHLKTLRKFRKIIS